VTIVNEKNVQCSDSDHCVELAAVLFGIRTSGAALLRVKSHLLVLLTVVDLTLNALTEPRAVYGISGDMLRRLAPKIDRNNAIWVRFRDHYCSMSNEKKKCKNRPVGVGGA
jgi:hypothetical protein